MITLYTQKSLIRSSTSYRIFSYLKRLKSTELENKYSDEQKAKILQVVNDSDASCLSSYNITKNRLKSFSQWMLKNGQIKQITEIESIEGFSEKTAKKLFDSIIEGTNNSIIAKKIKGQVLYPALSEIHRQSCRSVLAVTVTVYSVCWTLIDRSGYEVEEWKYHGIDYPDGRKLQIPDIYKMALDITKKLPVADIYVMKAEATTLRAAGSDPNNPKMLGVNLQKAQMIAMIVALINFRNNHSTEENDAVNKVYFLRPTLPFRLYGTLVGNERVATNETVENLLRDATARSPKCTKVFVPELLQTMFMKQEDLRKDMLGQCLLLALTFMDVCVYLNVESISKLLKNAKS